jgi:hypothetical protein
MNCGGILMLWKFYGRLNFLGSAVLVLSNRQKPFLSMSKTFSPYLHTNIVANENLH